ncbi:RDD family protein [Streptomyces sp. NPDC041068]|uniref:RDD family protein n=1 Tax=Streptomyces sp. NPDC041068 TaxID=3155130 RepID=UPI0033F3CEDE
MTARRGRAGTGSDSGSDSGSDPGSDSAGIVSRGIAAVLDALVLAATGLAVQVGAGCARLLVTGPPFRFPDLPLWLTGPVAWIFAVLYLGGAWAAIGHTAGGRLMGLRVTDRAGQLLRLPRSLARAALSVTFPLGLCWVLISARRASLQDLVVASEVRYERS